MTKTAALKLRDSVTVALLDINKSQLKIQIFQKMKKQLFIKIINNLNKMKMSDCAFCQLFQSDNLIFFTLKKGGFPVLENVLGILN